MNGNILAANSAAISQYPIDQPADIVEVASQEWNTTSETAADPVAMTSFDERTVNQVVEAANNMLEKKNALLVKLLANSDGKGRFSPGDLDAARADSEVAAHKLMNILLAAPSLSPLPEVSKTGSAASVMSGLKTSFYSATSPVQYYLSEPLAEKPKTDRDFLLGVGSGIDELNKKYVQVHEHAVSENLTFYEDFSKIYKDLATYFDPNDKGTHLLVRQGASIANEKGEIDETLPGLLDVLEALKEKYNSDQSVNGVLVAAQTKTGAEKWAEDLGMPATSVKQTNGIWRVMVDISPITEMIASLEKKHTIRKNPYTQALPPAVFNAWKVGFEGHEAKIKNSASLLASKLATANSRFESVIKILMGTYDAFRDMCKGFLN